MTQVPASSHGGGLPSQWTTDGHGNVTATADLAAPSPGGIVKVEAINRVADGQDVFQLLDKNGAPYVSFDDLGYCELITDRTQHTSTLKLEGTDNSFGTFLIEGSAWDAVAMSYVPSFQVLNSGIMRVFGGLATQVVTAGALPTVAPVSGVAFQCSTTRDVALVVPFTGDATNNAATLKIELSPDNTTYSILDTLSIAAALNLTGAINTPVSLHVPAGWYVKLTATHGTIGTSTYY